MTRSYDALVVGGGIIGLTSAWRMAERGMRVAVVDPEPGRGASWVAAGMLAPVTEVHYTEERAAGPDHGLGPALALVRRRTRGGGRVGRSATAPAGPSWWTPTRATGPGRTSSTASSARSGSR